MCYFSIFIIIWYKSSKSYSSTSISKPDCFISLLSSFILDITDCKLPLSIVTIFSIGFFIETTYEKIMQANGKSVSSMITQLSGAIFNIIFDPILIFGLLKSHNIWVKIINFSAF